MTNTNIVAAIVFGSSKITGIVGTKEIDGSIRVKAHVAQNSSDFIGKGRVLNVEKMTNCLSSIKSRLEEQSSCRIKCFYAAVDCQGLRSMTNEVTIHLSTSEIVTDELLMSIEQRNKEGKPATREILEAIPLTYRLGSKGTTGTLEPKGMQTDHLQAKFLNIVCNSNTVATITSCFRKAGIELVKGRLYIGVQHLATVITNEQERSTGAVIVDMGSETTTVAVYKGKLLRHLVVIPLGSDSITRDIENVFNVERDEAEHLKRTFGYPSDEMMEDKDSTIALRDGGRIKKYSELANIIDARMEEIVQNVKHQIGLTGLTHEHLVNGIYICGGGAQMKDIINAFKNHFKEWNVRIVKNTTRLVVACSDHNFNATGSYNTALGLINNADVNCYGGEYRGLFGEDEPTEEEKAAEAAKKAAEEERLRLAELEAARIAAEKAAAEKAAAEEAAKNKTGVKLGNWFRKAGKKLAELVSENEE